MSKAQVIAVVALLGIIGWWAYQQYGPSSQGQISSQPEAELVQFEQMKRFQISQVDAELEDLDAEIADIEVELEAMSKPSKPTDFHRVTIEEITAMLSGLSRPARFEALNEDLNELNKERTILLAKKPYLQQDVTELNFTVIPTNTCTVIAVVDACV